MSDKRDGRQKCERADPWDRVSEAVGDGECVECEKRKDGEYE